MTYNFFEQQRWYRELESNRIADQRDEEIREADITYRRHLGNMQSQEAHRRLLSRKEQRRADVLACIARFPPPGSP